ncbi:MAG: magnesium and cobalt exporter, family, partial [Actinomycetota bacterium]|nr:magnesium and cobalt exporter, family [Actinomycetota bacterium]
MNSDVIVIVVIVVLLAVSALMALAETAFVRISRIRLMNLADEGDKRADRLLRLLEHPERTLNSVLLVLLACQMISATLLGTLLEPSFGAFGVFVGIVFEITIVFTFAEVAPKTFAVQHAERAAMAVSGVLVFVTRFWLTR